MKLRNIVSILIVAAMMFSMISANAASENLKLYLEPQIMNDTTGYLDVKVNMKNFDAAGYLTYGDIYHLSFSFTYDTSAFTINTCEDGSLDVAVDENTLIKSADLIKTKVDAENGIVDFEFDVPKTSASLISCDGTLFNFTLKSKNVRGFWNSFDKYPIRFDYKSIKVNTYNYLVSKEYEVKNVIAYDCNVGAYNKEPTLQPKSVNKTVEFSENSNYVIVDGEQIETDARPFVKNDVLMVPVRYLVENIGMEIEWNGEEMLASAYADYITLKISMMDNKTYINAALVDMETMPEEIDGRIYVPVTIVSKVYPTSTCTVEGNTAVIYVP